MQSFACASFWQQFFWGILRPYVSGRYFHVFNFPILPLRKEATVFCQTCGGQRGYTLDKETRSRFKYPWNTYIGASIVIVFVLLVLLAKVW
jgi:hypothetical protein